MVTGGAAVGGEWPGAVVAAELLVDDEAGRVQQLGQLGGV
ncbi:hypothetical protein SZN_06811 [Streptomyces zinciresistens K42]|uniref:Uncharacterized protein n=1 Tax=Streptomyces zinciresistens K42 TaxID=700597 RepID=G2G7A0_9ACTN|nr:hypothetical protein SZN_06811 [Streptomyces zinciresistens K42]